ncbi:MAG: hypothetical protein ACR2RE_19105 [Geminicoccaceae bacterium]
MTTLNPIVLAADLGYDVTNVKGGGSEGAAYTLEKDGRKLIIDQKLLDDCAGMLKPVTNPNPSATVKSVA